MGDPAEFAVRVSAGSLRHVAPDYLLPHAWTEAGVAVEGAGTGAHLLHCAVAVCVLNDVFREARSLEVVVEGVAVTAAGGFDPAWASTGISYDLQVDGVDDARLVELVSRVDAVAEIPRALRSATTVARTARGGDHG